MSRYGAPYGADDDAAWCDVDVDGAVGAALAALEASPSLGVAAGDAASDAPPPLQRGWGGWAGRGAAPPVPQATQAVVSPPPSLPDHVFLLSGPSERRRALRSPAPPTPLPEYDDDEPQPSLPPSPLPQRAAAAAAHSSRSAASGEEPDDVSSRPSSRSDSRASSAAATPRQWQSTPVQDDEESWQRPVTAEAAPRAALHPPARSPARAPRRGPDSAALASMYASGADSPPPPWMTPLEAREWRVERAEAALEAAAAARAETAADTRATSATPDGSDAGSEEELLRATRAARAATAALAQLAAAAAPKPPPAPSPPPPLPPLPPQPRAPRRGEEGYAESVFSEDDVEDEEGYRRGGHSTAPPSLSVASSSSVLLSRLRARNAPSPAGSDESWMKPAADEEIAAATAAAEDWGVPSRAASSLQKGKGSEGGWDARPESAASDAPLDGGGARTPPPPPPPRSAKADDVAANVARGRAASVAGSATAASAAAPSSRSVASAPARVGTLPFRFGGGAVGPDDLDPSPVPPPRPVVYRPTDEDHRVPVPDLVGDLTIVPGAILEAGTRLASAWREELDRDVAAQRARAASALEAIVLALSLEPGANVDADNAPLAPWQRSMLEMGASIEQELARRQAKASATFRALEQEQLRISLLMQDTAGAAASNGKTLLQSWLEKAFGSKAEYEEYISKLAARMCMLPGSRAACVNILRSLEPMRREAVAKRRAKLAEEHRATVAVIANVATGDEDDVMAALPGATPPALARFAQGGGGGGGGGGRGHGGVRGPRGGAAATSSSAEPREPGPWEAPLLDVPRRPGSPGDGSVVLERLPGMTDEDLERLNDFMGSDAGSLWGGEDDVDALSEAEAAQRVARMVAEARAAAAMRAEQRAAAAADAEVAASAERAALRAVGAAASPGQRSAGGSAASARGRRSASPALPPPSAPPTPMPPPPPPSPALSERPESVAGSVSGDSVAPSSAAPPPSMRRSREPTPVQPQRQQAQAQHGYNAFEYEPPSAEQQRVWEAELTAAQAAAAAAAEQAAAWEAEQAELTWQREQQREQQQRKRTPPSEADSLASLQSGGSGSRRAGSAAPSVAPGVASAPASARQRPPSTAPTSAAPSSIATEDYAHVPPPHGAAAAGRHARRAASPASSTGLPHFPIGPPAAVREGSVAAASPPPSDSDWGYDHSVQLRQRRPAEPPGAQPGSPGAAFGIAEALAARMGSPGAAAVSAAAAAAARARAQAHGAEEAEGDSSTGWVRDRETGAWSPATSRAPSRADSATSAASSTLSRRSAAAGAAGSKVGAAAAAVLPRAAAIVAAQQQERWKRIWSDVAKVTLLLLLGAILTFLLILTFF